MYTDLQFLEEWIPEKMDPGTVFLLENQSKLGHAQNPYIAVMSCPRCGTMGLITTRQLCEKETMICGGDTCSAEYASKAKTSAFAIPNSYSASSNDVSSVLPNMCILSDGRGATEPKDLRCLSGLFNRLPSLAF